jgi:hypothetical protein
MKVLKFTNKYKGHTTDSVIINPSRIVCVFDGIWTDEATNEVSSATRIMCMAGHDIAVEESLDEVLLQISKA